MYTCKTTIWKKETLTLCSKGVSGFLVFFFPVFFLTLRNPACVCDFINVSRVVYNCVALRVNAPGTPTVTDVPRVMRGNARGGALEYEHVDPALLHFEKVDFLDDAVGARAAPPIHELARPVPAAGEGASARSAAIPAAPSGQSRVGGTGGEGVGGQGEMVDVVGNRKKDMTSLFAGVEDECGDIFNNLQVKK